MSLICYLILVKHIVGFTNHERNKCVQMDTMDFVEYDLCDQDL